MSIIDILDANLPALADAAAAEAERHLAAGRAVLSSRNGRLYRDQQDASGNIISIEIDPDLTGGSDPLPNVGLATEAAALALTNR